jgi:hypothetical protein
MLSVNPVKPVLGAETGRFDASIPIQSTIPLFLQCKPLIAGFETYG